MSRPLLRLGAALLVLAGSALLPAATAGPAAAGPAAAAGRFPAQFVAKLYTEGLGRMPDADGWAFQQGVFARQDCSIDTVRDTARSFYTSPEFLGATTSRRPGCSPSTGVRSTGNPTRRASTTSRRSCTSGR